MKKLLTTAAIACAATLLHAEFKVAFAVVAAATFVSPQEKSPADGAAAVFEKFQDRLEAGKAHVVLHNPGDCGNVGTIVRTALGFGTEDIALGSPSTPTPESASATACRKRGSCTPGCAP